MTVASQAFLRAFSFSNEKGETFRKAARKCWAGRLVVKVATPTCLRQEIVEDRLEFGLSCLRYVGYALYLGFPSPFLPGSRARKALAGLRSLCVTVLSVAANRGKAAVLSWLKDLAGDARRIALGDLRPFQRTVSAGVREYLRGFWSLQGKDEEGMVWSLLQFASFARALPEPPQSVVDKALERHKETLTTPHVTDPSYVADFRSWVGGWCTTFLPTEMNVSSCLSTSASFECTRTQGGSLSVLRGIADAYRQEEIGGANSGPWFGVSDAGPCRWGTLSDEALAARGGLAPRDVCEYLYDKTWCEDHGVTLERWEELREHLFLRDACLSEAAPILSGQRRPRCRQTAVKTRGGKARVVTAIESPFVYLCHYWRVCLLAGLRIWGPTALILREDHLVALEEWMRQIPMCDMGDRVLVRSVDMSEATDRFALDLMGGAVEGIADHFGLNRNGWEYLLLRSSVGEYDMACADGTTVRTRRAVLMGLPTSWPLLCLYNAWLWSRANGPPLVPVWTVDDYCSLDACLICGDDLLGLGPQAASDRYDVLLTETGGKTSEGKDYLSARRGLFTEVAVDVRLQKPIVVGSVKGLTAVGDCDEPTWLIAGPATISAALGAGGTLRARCATLAAYHHRKVIGAMRDCGIHPFVPREMGGGGFLPRRAGVSVPGRSLARAIRVLMSGQQSDLQSLRGLYGLSSVWKSNKLTGSSSFHSQISVDVWSHFEARVREGLRLFDSGPSTLSLLRARSVRDHIDSECAQSLGAYLLVFGLNGDLKGRRETLSKTARRLREWVRETNALVPTNRLADRVRALDIGFKRFRDRLLRLSFCGDDLDGPSLVCLGRTRGKRGFEEGHFISGEEAAVKRRRVAALSRDLHGACRKRRAPDRFRP